MARQTSVAGYNEFLRHQSWYLCRLLDRIIGTEDAVALDRKCGGMNSYANDCMPSMKTIQSGSRGEGFNFPTSDLDLMFIDENIVVLESIHNTMLADDSKTVLLMTREECNPGFVILQLLNRTSNRSISESIVEYHGHPVVSSLLYRDVNRIPEFDQVGHGPCNTSRYLIEMDMAVCFECKTWPNEANEFIYRQRKYEWPKKSLLNKIVYKGCHLVAVGDKCFDLSHIQWRLSFSAAEKYLVHSFNHTQFLVYGLLKIFLKQFVNKCQGLDGVLCSYFLKTTMFYCIESTPSLLWREDLLIPCFWFSLNKLITWVEQGYCPNYFVSQNNMFRNKEFGNIQHRLEDVLNQCRRVGWTCLVLCRYLGPIQNVFVCPKFLYDSKLIVSDREREFLTGAIASGLEPSQPFIHPEHAHKVFVRALTLFRHCRTQQEESLSRLLLQSVLRGIGKSNACFGQSNNNKDKYKTMKKRQRLLSTSLGNMGYVEMLDIATFYQQTGQYKKAVYILERVIAIWKPYVLYRSYDILVDEEDLYQRYVCGRDISFDRKISLVNDIMISKFTSHPEELCDDLDVTYPLPLNIPPLPFTVFLLFLCYHKLGNIDKSLFSLHDLEVLSRDNAQGFEHCPVVLNMLAICLDKLGNIHRAVELCLLSQEMKPVRNGASRLLDKILSRLF